MATVQNPDQQITPAPVAPVGPQSTGGAGVAGTAKPAANTAGQNVPAQPSAQLSAYLNANQPQAAAMGQTVAQTMGNQVNSAGQAILPAVNTYTGQLTNVPVDTTVNQQVATHPSALTAQQEQSFQNELGAAQNAPNSSATFEKTPAYQDLTQNIQNAVGQANLWNSGNNVADLSTALQPFEPKNATSGDVTLDSLLLSQSPGAYQQIQQAAAPAANLQSQLGAGTTQADQSLQTAIANDQAATAAAQAAPQSFAANLANYLKGAVSQAQGTATSQEAQILADAKAGTLTPADDTALGITTTQGQKLNAEANPISVMMSSPVGINLANYLTQSPVSEINAANVANPVNYSDVAMLQNILGGNAPVEPIDSSTTNEAGNLPNLNSFNLAAALAAFQAANPPAPTPPPSSGGPSDVRKTNLYNTIGIPVGELLGSIGSFFTGLNQGGLVKDKEE